MTQIVLRPTLWRTCRVLANRERLRMLALLIRERTLRVSAVAARLQIPMARASLSLRALETRGLLRVRRTGPEVSYQLATDGSLAGLLSALRRTLNNGKRTLPLAFALATAFTHPRRIEIYRALGSQPQKLAELTQTTRIPANALLRHLHKLQARGFITHPRRRGFYSVTVHGHSVGRALAELATG